MLGSLRAKNITENGANLRKTLYQKSERWSVNIVMTLQVCIFQKFQFSNCCFK